MKHSPSSTRSLNPYLGIFLLFSAWKLVLLSLALLTPSPSYDTSTSLILQASQRGSAWALTERLCEKLTRWDAIYFVKAAERGYANEQEWAFGWGFVKAISGVERVLSSAGITFGLQPPYLHALSAILIANISHLLSTLVLYKSTLLAFRTPIENVQNMAFIAACLHILSPAGLFLSAPYSESLFSLLSFTGTFLYIWSDKNLKNGGVFRGNIATLGSAVIFSSAVLVRSNGLLNGVLFLHDLFHQIVVVITKPSGVPKRVLLRLLRIGVLGAGGLMIGIGVVIPQVIAWRDYCTEGSSRVWCSKTLPSIYFFVQDHYWNVGIFRYWNVPNIPLFLLATPMLTVMVTSGLWGTGIKNTAGMQSIAFEKALLRKLAFPQLLLAVMAIISYHVQIITRLSSGSMIWYWWVAYQMSAEGVAKQGRTGRDWAKWVVRWMVVYGVVQGTLFSGFLPPA